MFFHVLLMKVLIWAHCTICLNTNTLNTNTNTDTTTSTNRNTNTTTNNNDTHRGGGCCGLYCLFLQCERWRTWWVVANMTDCWLWESFTVSRNKQSMALWLLYALIQPVQTQERNSVVHQTLKEHSTHSAFLFYDIVGHAVDRPFYFLFFYNNQNQCSHWG